MFLPETPRNDQALLTSLDYTVILCMTQNGAEKQNQE